MRRCGLLFIVLVLLLAGCGGDDGSTGDTDEAFDAPESTDEEDGDDPTDVDPCELLDQDEVEELLGQPVDGDPEGEELDGGRVCTWSTEADSQSESVDGPVQLYVEVGELTDDIEADVRQAAEDPTSLPLDFGDLAIHICVFEDELGTGCGTYDNVAVLVGETYLEVDLKNWGYPADYEQEEGAEITQEAAQLATDALG